MTSTKIRIQVHCRVLLLVLLMRASPSVGKMKICAKRVYLARAEQADEQGLRCWDNVRVPACGGRCDSREISDWEFPFKKSHHPVCVYASRRPVMVRLRYCDPAAAPGTEIFHYVAAEECRCKVCSSQHTSCEWLPPNSTFLSTIYDDDYDDDSIDSNGDEQSMNNQ